MSSPANGSSTPRKHPETISLDEISLTDRNGGFHRMRTAPKGPKKKAAEDYFTGPRDMTHHSKWPFFFQVHGSVLPEMILPMLIVGIWATIVTVMCKVKFPDHQFDPILLTVLGFLVGLTLSFRQSTAYERYMEGRRLWAALTTSSENLARIFWLHAREREDEQGKEDLLAKLSALNLIVAFAVALKHKLQYQPYMDYADLRGYVEHLDTFAKTANAVVDTTPTKVPKWKRVGQFLNLSFAEDNPRGPLKNAPRPLGNLPLEIICYLQTYADTIIENKTLIAPAYQMQSITMIQSFNDVLNGCERVLNTPLPLAYSIAIAHISWVYIILLPFQLYKRLGWNTIPATLLSAYIILGLAFIGAQIENPFGEDVNDLPMDAFCNQIAHDIDVISSKSRVDHKDYFKNEMNLPLYPLSTSGYESWAGRSEEEIREALGMKVQARFRAQNDEEKPGIIRRKTEFPDA